MGPRERVWGYTGASGMVQGFAAGYFLWDLVTSAVDLDVHGPGELMHAVSALAVSLLGFVSVDWTETKRTWSWLTSASDHSAIITA